MTHSLPTITVTLVDGTQLVVPDSLDLITPYVLQEQGDWFEDEIKFLRRLAQPGQTVVDIGANYGVYSLSLARRVGPKGQVWAFEPASATADLLAESINANGTSWVHLQRKALSDHLGTAWLQMPGQSELNSLGPEQGPGEEVPLTTLDECLEEFGWQKVDLLKIDAEGEEGRILSGGQRFFRELSPLVMFEVKAGDDLHLELVEQFGALGYKSYRLVPGLDALAPFSPRSGVDGYLLNLFAAKADRAAELVAKGWLVETAEPHPPEDHILVPYHWQKSLSELPYVHALKSVWLNHQSLSGISSASSKALALWSFSQDNAQPISERLGALKQGFDILIENCDQTTPLPRWGSLARLALELGERTTALRALGNLIPFLENALASDLIEPFLSPSTRFDRLSPEGRPVEWLKAAAMETDELQGSYSSFFNGAQAKKRLEKLVTLDFIGTTLYSRLQVLNKRFPPRIEASPEMALTDPDQIAHSKSAWDLIREGSLKTGETRLRESQQMGDNCPRSLHFIGKALLALGYHAEGSDVLQRAVELDPNNPSVLLELGMSLKLIGEPKAAKGIIQQAIFLYCFRFSSQEPTAVDLANLGIAYDELNDKEQALKCLDQSLVIDPEFENALLRKASILLNIKERHDEASAIWEHLLADKPGRAGVLANQAGLLISYGEIAKATSILEEVIRIVPGFRDAHYMLAFAHSIAGEAAISDHLQHLKSYWEMVRGNEAREFHAPLAFAMPVVGKKLRIGFLSAELGDHVVSYFIEPFLSHYDRSRFEVELIEVREHNSRRANWLLEKADAVVSVQDLGIGEARSRLRARGYDVILETSGFTSNSGLEILARRCALVQCHYIGFHATTGLDTIDWFIGDDLTAGEDIADQFVERLWRLPRLWLASRKDPSLPNAHSNLHSERPVLGSFSQFAKVQADTIHFWGAAMRRLPNAELHIKNYTTDSDVPRHRILDQLSAEGIHPSRVAFLPRTSTWQDHIECYRSIDIALDTTPWAGATTTFEALSMGVPMVAILGNTFCSRMSSSILTALGKQHWITTTPDAFADTVEDLVQDLALLRASKAKLQAEVLNSTLFDGVDLTHHLQVAIERMVEEAAINRLQTGT